ncbi:unnamed protein product [Peronospora belbahrii]|uniref:Uncharacterized protein n=1 Tax=Peronospora belbahrii TaxID=622444 RepID=A0AAU9KUX3_9STRA|nr:unnamed protein product [Peronospora belbahrii]
MLTDSNRVSYKTDTVTVFDNIGGKETQYHLNRYSSRLNQFANAVVCSLKKVVDPGGRLSMSTEIADRLTAICSSHYQHIVYTVV